jgi:hypothetical protein
MAPTAAAPSTSSSREGWNGSDVAGVWPPDQRSTSPRLVRRRHGRFVPRPVRRGRPDRASARRLIRGARRGGCGVVRGMGPRHPPPCSPTSRQFRCRIAGTSRATRSQSRSRTGPWTRRSAARGGRTEPSRADGGRTPMPTRPSTFLTTSAAAVSRELAQEVGSKSPSQDRGGCGNGVVTEWRSRDGGARSGLVAALKRGARYPSAAGRLRSGCLRSGHGGRMGRPERLDRTSRVRRRRGVCAPRRRSPALAWQRGSAHACFADSPERR